MKKLLIILLLCDLQSAICYGETLTQLRTRVDTWLTNRWPTWVSRQETFKTNNGRYWQGLITHTTIPVHVTATAGDSIGDRLTLHPTDQTSAWADAFPEFSSENLAAAMVVDVYRGPLGQGWVATVFVRFNGTIYTRTQQVGPETWRNSAWAIWAPEP